MEQQEHDLLPSPSVGFRGRSVRPYVRPSGDVYKSGFPAEGNTDTDGRNTEAEGERVAVEEGTNERASGRLRMREEIFRSLSLPLPPSFTHVRRVVKRAEKSPSK